MAAVSKKKSRQILPAFYYLTRLLCKACNFCCEVVRSLLNAFALYEDNGAFNCDLSAEGLSNTCDISANGGGIV